MSPSGPISEVSPLSGYRLRLTHRLSRQHGTWSTIGKFNRNIREIVTVRTKSLFSIGYSSKKIKLRTFLMLHKMIWCCYSWKWGSYLTRSWFKIWSRLTWSLSFVFTKLCIVTLCADIILLSHCVDPTIIRRTVTSFRVTQNPQFLPHRSKPLFDIVWLALRAVSLWKGSRSLRIQHWSESPLRKDLDPTLITRRLATCLLRGCSQFCNYGSQFFTSSHINCLNCFQCLHCLHCLHCV